MAQNPAFFKWTLQLVKIRVSFPGCTKSVLTTRKKTAKSESNLTKTSRKISSRLFKNVQCNICSKKKQDAFQLNCQVYRTVNGGGAHSRRSRLPTYIIYYKYMRWDFFKPKFAPFCPKFFECPKYILFDPNLLFFDPNIKIEIHLFKN